MMPENNLFYRNSTNDIQEVKLTYALVILISSIETENQLPYCGSTINQLEDICKLCFNNFKGNNTDKF